MKRKIQLEIDKHFGFHANKLIAKEDKKSISKFQIKWMDDEKIKRYKKMNFYFLLEFVENTRFCVVDVDNISFINKLPSGVFQKTLIVSTPSGGQHWWFKLPMFTKLPPIYSVFSKKPVLLQQPLSYENAQTTTERTIDLLTFPGQIAIPPTKDYYIIMEHPIAEASPELMEFWMKKANEARKNRLTSL